MVFLVVDDNPKMRESVKQFLASRIPDHHTIHEASDGWEAIDLYERRRPDWVLMDIKMEPLGGLEASRAILAAHPDAKVIILTNYDDDQYRRAAIATGVRAFLLKEQLHRIPELLADQPALP